MQWIGISNTITGKTHRLVINSLKTSMEPKLRKIGANMDHLIDRNKKDYKDSVTGLHFMTKMALMLAQRIISTLDTL